MPTTTLITGCLVLLLPSQAATPSARITYRCVLTCPGGELPFELRLSDPRHIHSRAWIVNGGESVDIPQFSRSGRKLILDFPHYDSRIEAEWDEAAGKMSGTWTKSGGKNPPTSLPFHAEAGAAPRFKPNLKLTADVTPSPPVTGRWAVRFSGSEEPAVGLFEEKKDRVVEGTFLTVNGDYRYLAGSYEHGLLRLSCFDGSHAFLFIAQAQPDGSLKGDFWSGAKWHESWTAVRDDKAALKDGFERVRAKDKVNFAALKFKNPAGQEQIVEELVFGAKGVLIEIFGTWCPNCHDAAGLLSELHRNFGSRGLKIVALAFERGDGFEKDAAQVKRYIDRRKTAFPVLIAGPADRNAVVRALPFLESFRAWPTFLFVNADGSVAAIYTGFSGPATGEEYTKLRDRFRYQVELLLR